MNFLNVFYVAFVWFVNGLNLTSLPKPYFILISFPFCFSAYYYYCYTFFVMLRKFLFELRFTAVFKILFLSASFGQACFYEYTFVDRLLKKYMCLPVKWDELVISWEYLTREGKEFFIWKMHCDVHSLIFYLLLQVEFYDWE